MELKNTHTKSPSFLGLLVFLLFFTLTASAQEKFTDYLQRTQVGGVVVLHQDAEIDKLVNGNLSGRRIGEGAMQEYGDSTVIPQSGRHTTGNGYRVQIVSLGSTAKEKATAESMGKKVKVYFPETNVYVSFISPHYVCRIGDFKTREEANEMLKRVKETNQFNSASIVRSKINIYY